MKTQMKSIALLLVVTAICTTRSSFAQPFRSFSSFLNPDCAALDHENHEFVPNGQSVGSFYCNPLVLDGTALKMNNVNLKSKGELRLTKGDANTNKVIEIPFYIHLRRKDSLVKLPCGEGVRFMKIEISDIMEVAQPGDQLIIEPVNAEDWPAKRILDVREGGC